MKDSGSRSAVSVGTGILLSRATGYLRDAAIAFFFGTSRAVDAYAAALRIPNILRNLLGEGTLSAAFVPVYSAMLGRSGDPSSPADATRLARSVLGRLLVLAGLLTALGVLLAPLLTRIVAPGFDRETAALTTRLVRILFPMAGVMIVAAWCLGVLSSHRRFFLPFAAPVLWNLSQIVGLLLGARMGWAPLVEVLAWSTLLGAVLQLAVQLPASRRLAGGWKPLWSRGWDPVRRVLRNMAPVAAGQGLFQVSSYLDVVLASLLPSGAIAGLYYAQRVAYLPLSLFGVSVATASLPEMSRDRSTRTLRLRLQRGFQHILYFVLPASVALILFGDLIIGVLFQRRAFNVESRALVNGILSAYALGLVASSSVKLFASGFHALQDTRTPVRYAAVAIAVGTGLGATLMLWLRSRGLGPEAAAGLALGGACGAWLNLWFLWRGLGKRVGRLADRELGRQLLRIVVATGAAALAAVFGRGVLGGVLGDASVLARLGVLSGTLLFAGVPYLLIAGRPPATLARAEEGTEI